MKQIFHFALVLGLTVAAILSCCNNEQSAPAAPAETAAEPTTLETIFSRKSVREYTDQVVTDEQVETLLRAAMAAPSGMDRRPWRFVVIRDPEVRAALVGQSVYTECSVLIAVCGETTMSWRDGEVRDNPNWTADCAAATENLLLAAESMGLGAVWTAGYPYPDRMDPARDVLGLPDNVSLYCLVPVGYPAGDAQPKDKWNPENIHHDRW